MISCGNVLENERAEQRNKLREIEKPFVMAQLSLNGI